MTSHTTDKNGYEKVKPEDQALHDELPGYREYASRVRYRLIPGIF